MVTSIEAKQETFRSRFESERKDGGRYVATDSLPGRYVANGSKPRSVLLVFVSDRSLSSEWKQAEKRPTCFLRRYVATDSLTGRYVASGSKPRSVLLVFVVKSQQKLRLRRNEKRFDEDSKDNPKEDLSEALQVATLTGRYVASGSKPRRIPLVFVVKSQRKLRLRRNEKRFDEDSKENPKKDLSEALQVATDRAVCVLGRYVATEQRVRARSLRSDRAVCVLGRYVATEQRVRARSLRSDRAACVLGRYVATKQRVSARSLRSDRAATEQRVCLRPSRVSARSLRSDRAADRAACVLGRYVATEQHVRARSLRSDRAVCVLGRYVATELCNRFVVFPFSAINVGVFQRFFLGEQVLSFRNVFGKRVLRQTVGTEICTVDFRLNKETRKTLISQRSRISARANDNLEKTVDLISSPRKSVAIITREYKGFGRRGRQRAAYVPLSRIKPNVVQLIELDKRSNCLGEFVIETELVENKPKHKNGDITFFPIFTIIFKTSVFIRGNLTFILPCGPSVNQSVVYGLLVRKIIGWASSRVLGPFGPSSDSTRLLRNSGKHGLSLLRSSGDSIRRFDENARTGVRPSETLELGRYVATERDDRSRPSGTIARSLRARSLRSDRALAELGRYVATERDDRSRPSLAELELGRYVATERDDRSVATDRAGRSLGRYVATELWLELGRYVATELCACLVAAYRSSLACPRSDFHTQACPRPIWIHVRCLRTIGI
ncbi:hypothetical protein IGI04_042612 [Brassica rapa subsp. trilocularis]|uniref:Uncharacterized protein n=1 Tax=Brassica rapa subsp. trilocularis TaxID=1813537 RepID=A0ABQ7KHU8_BRACM|nr:hypothetical protein IGI04_042612 [Brassica rapa subsp. trilocularis]